MLGRPADRIPAMKNRPSQPSSALVSPRAVCIVVALPCCVASCHEDFRTGAQNERCMPSGQVSRMSDACHRGRSVSHYAARHTLSSLSSLSSLFLRPFRSVSLPLPLLFTAVRGCAHTGCTPRAVGAIWLSHRQRLAKLAAVGAEGLAVLKGWTWAPASQRPQLTHQRVNPEGLEKSGDGERRAGSRERGTGSQRVQVSQSHIGAPQMNSLRVCPLGSVITTPHRPNGWCTPRDTWQTRESIQLSALCSLLSTLSSPLLSPLLLFSCSPSAIPSALSCTGQGDSCAGQLSGAGGRGRGAEHLGRRVCVQHDEPQHA